VFGNEVAKSAHLFQLILRSIAEAAIEALRDDTSEFHGILTFDIQAARGAAQFNVDGSSFFDAVLESILDEFDDVASPLSDYSLILGSFCGTNPSE
jgi:hypothetical protein